MAHPEGGKGNSFPVRHTFGQAYDHVGPRSVTFRSTTGEEISATINMARDNKTRTIVFHGERSRHGSVCKACWDIELTAMDLVSDNVQSLWINPSEKLM